MFRKNIKKILKCLKEYETVEYNSQRLNCNYNDDVLIFNRLYDSLYSEDVKEFEDVFNCE